MRTLERIPEPTPRVTLVCPRSLGRLIFPILGCLYCNVLLQGISTPYNLVTFSTISSIILKLQLNYEDG